MPKANLMIDLNPDTKKLLAKYVLGGSLLTGVTAGATAAGSHKLLKGREKKANIMQPVAKFLGKGFGLKDKAMNATRSGLDKLKQTGRVFNTNIKQTFQNARSGKPIPSTKDTERFLAKQDNIKSQLIKNVNAGKFKSPGTRSPMTGKPVNSSFAGKIKSSWSTLPESVKGSAKAVGYGTVGAGALYGGSKILAQPTNDMQPQSYPTY